MLAQSVELEAACPKAERAALLGAAEPLDLACLRLLIRMLRVDRFRHDQEVLAPLYKGASI